MADPLFAATAEMLAFAAKAADLFDLAYATNVDTPLENLRNDLEGDYAQAARDGIDTLRDSAAGYLSEETQRLVMDPILEQITESVGVQPVLGDPEANWVEIYDAMIASSDTVNAIEWTFGTPAAGGSNVGDMTVARLATDEDNQRMEAFWSDTYTLKAENDYLSGAREHTAIWSLRGTPAGPDGRPIEGAPFADLSIVQHSDLTSEGLSNPSFDLGTFSGSTITALTGWTTVSGNFTAFETNTTATFIFLDTTQSGGTARSLRFVGNDTMYQELQETGGFTLVEDEPYRFGVWLYRRDTADGTFTIRLTDVDTPTSGGISRAVTVTTLGDNAWTFIDLVATPGQNNWPKNFRIEQLTVSYQLAGRTTGSIHLDTVIQSRWDRVGSMGQARKGRSFSGVYLHVLAGQAQTIKGDLFTWTDSKGSATVNQRRVGLEGARYGYLPSATAAAETVADK